MYEPVESIIHPANRNGERRVFVWDELDTERKRQVARRVMDVYAVVTGKEFGAIELEHYPDYIAAKLDQRPHFQIMLGIPKLEWPADTRGKLWGRAIDVHTHDEELRTTGFWLDTNDTDYFTPMPQASAIVVEQFNQGICRLADNEFGDVTMPIPMAEFNDGVYTPSDVSL